MTGKIEKVTDKMFELKIVFLVLSIINLAAGRNTYLQLYDDSWLTQPNPALQAYTRWSPYLDINNNVLVGHTPVYSARLNSLDSSKIVHDLFYWPTPRDNFDFQFARLEESAARVHDEIDSIKELLERSNLTTPRKKRELSADTVYPEILVVLDYDTYVAYKGNLVNLTTYVAAFWNGVDLRLRDMQDPKIRLNIAGLVVPTDPKTEPYLRRNATTGYFDSITATLSNIGTYFEKSTIKNYDIVAVVTRKNLTAENEYIFGITEGAAFESSVCTKNHSVMLIKDGGGFEGISNAVYNLAKLLGSPHDLTTNSELNVENGCLIRVPKDQWTWPNCSIVNMQNYLRSDSAKCLRNKPDVVVPKTKKLPGQILSRDEQCDQLYPGDTSYGEVNSCNLLKCKKCSFLTIYCDYRSYKFPPAEGSACGRGWICLKGECIKEYKQLYH